MTEKDLTGIGLACALVALIQSDEAHAQVEACMAVYKNAVVDVTESDKERTELSYVFNLFCESSGQMKTFQSNASASFPIKGLPISANGGVFSDESELKSFCKVGSQKHYFLGTENVKERTVVGSALNSFNDCVEIARGNPDLVFSHEIALPNRLIISGKFRTNTTAGTLDSVSYDSEIMECKTSNFGKKDQILHDSENISIGSGNFTITCTRNPMPSDQEESPYYPLAEVVVGTSWGSYKATAPADRFQGFQLASTAELAHADLMARVADLDKKLTSEAALADLWEARYRSVTAYRLTIGEWAQGARFHVACGSQKSRFENSDTRKQMARSFCAEEGQGYFGLIHVKTTTEFACGTKYQVLLCAGTP